MDPKLVDDLARRISVIERNAVYFRKGIITAIGPATVELGDSGETLDIAALDSAPGIVNDQVAVLTWGNDAMIIGRINAFDGISINRVHPRAVTTVAGSFNTGWSDFAGGTTAARYWRDPYGLVHIEGAVQRTSGVLTTIFTLPSGYRPGGIQDYPVATGGFGATYGVVRLNTDGTVVFNGGTATYVSFGHLIFRASGA